MKKTALIVTLVLLAAVYAFAQTAADFGVTLTDDGAGVVITTYSGKATAVRVPATIEGMPVREIGSEAFSKRWATYHLDPITSITLPAGLTKIGYRAFEGSTMLASVVIPDTVTEIGDEAFARCGTASYDRNYGLATVTLPKGLVKAGKNIFYDCRNLKTVTIPQGVAVIGAGMFSGCWTLTTLNIPGSVKSIGEQAFYQSGLTSITLSPGITIIPQSAFFRCEKLRAIVIPEGVTEIEAEVFDQCKALTSVSLPSTIKKIGYAAFRSCEALTTVTIPDSVTAIEGDSNNEGSLMGAFYLCPKLTLASQAAIKRRAIQKAAPAQSSWGNQ
jgi:hypothetical protein